MVGTIGIVHTFAFPHLLAENEKCVHYNLMGGTVLHWLGFCKAPAGKENNSSKIFEFRNNKTKYKTCYFLCLSDIARPVQDYQ